MPVRAVLLYLNAKIRREVYVTDMLFYTARGFVKEPDNLTRYYDLIKPLPVVKKVNYTVQDVVDMFRGKGKLCD